MNRIIIKWGNIIKEIIGQDFSDRLYIDESVFRQNSLDLAHEILFGTDIISDENIQYGCLFIVGNGKTYEILFIIGYIAITITDKGGDISIHGGTDEYFNTIDYLLLDKCIYDDLIKLLYKGFTEDDVNIIYNRIDKFANSVIQTMKGFSDHWDTNPNVKSAKSE